MRFILERKNYGTLYHFTSLTSLYMIIQSDRIETDKPLEDLYQDNIDSESRIKNLEEKYPLYISTTRNKLLYKKDHGILNFLSSKIELDADKLTDNFKVFPVNWFSYYDRSKHVDDENEEAILLRKGTHHINLRKYVKSITLPTYELFLKEIYSYEEDYRYMIDMFTEEVLADLEIEINVSIEDIIREQKEGGTKELQLIYDTIVKKIKRNMGYIVSNDFLN